MFKLALGGAKKLTISHSEILNTKMEALTCTSRHAVVLVP